MTSAAMTRAGAADAERFGTPGAVRLMGPASTDLIAGLTGDGSGELLRESEKASEGCGDAPPSSSSVASSSDEEVYSSLS